MLNAPSRLTRLPAVRTVHYLAVALAVLFPTSAAPALEGVVTVPVISGQPETRPFTGHPGWVDVYTAGYNLGVSARIGEDGRFELPDLTKPVTLIAMFDRIETPPVILPRWPLQEGDTRVPIPVEYACMPEGYPETWDREFKQRAQTFYQTFTARCTQLYGVSVFDGPGIAEWGNQLHISVHAGSPRSEPLPVNDKQSPDPMAHGTWDRMTTGKSNQGLPRAGWRHGNINTVPGWTYAIGASGYHSHSGKKFDLDAYVRPDSGDGFPEGEAFADDTATGGDLCCLIFGNSHGQYVENQIRTEEWEVFLPAHRPATDWGQTFEASGVSLAGISFWASGGDEASVHCEILIREDGPGGRILKPTKAARSHVSPHSPFVRYPELPAPLSGYEAYYAKPCFLYQAAWMPDEIPLQPGKTYYVQLRPDKPLLVYADGDYYQKGYAWYESLKVERQETGRATLHSARWTLAMNIVTYAKPGGVPLNDAGQ